jgi:SH3-like domain-containing protein
VFRGLLVNQWCSDDLDDFWWFKEDAVEIVIVSSASTPADLRYHLLLELAPCSVQGCTEEWCSDETSSGSTWCHCHWSFHLNTVVCHTEKEKEKTQNSW